MLLFRIRLWLWLLHGIGRVLVGLSRVVFGLWLHHRRLDDGIRAALCLARADAAVLFEMLNQIVDIQLAGHPVHIGGKVTDVPAKHVVQDLRAHGQ